MFENEQHKAPREIERDVEATRAQVADTLDELQLRLSETVDDWKTRLSPDELKREAKDYGRRLIGRVGENLASKARENPAQALAVGAAVAWPVVRLLTKIPLPVYLIGAGMFMLRPPSGLVDRTAADIDPYDRETPDSYVPGGVAGYGYPVGEEAPGAGSLGHTGMARSLGEKAAAAADLVREGVTSLGSGMASAAERAGSSASERLREGADRVGTGLSSLGETVQSAAEKAQSMAADLVGRASSGVSRVSEAVSGAVSGAASSAMHGVRHIGSDASASIASASHAVGDRASRLKRRVEDVHLSDGQVLAIGALGLAAGAALAMRLPATRVENRMLGPAREAAGDLARDVAAEQYERGKAMAEEAYWRAREQAKAYGIISDDESEWSEPRSEPGRDVHSPAP